MEDLIKALTILLKYGNPKYPTACEHDTLYVCGIKSADVSEEDRKELDALGFFCKETTEDPDENWEDQHDGFMSFRYGSC